MTYQIELEHVEKHYGAYHALKDINLQIRKGSFAALVGPSGCGKSTLLRSLAGLEKISSGNLKIEGALMNDVPPRKRDIAMVFQSYALYPHMTVEKNLTYSLRMRGVAKQEARKRAAEVAVITGLDGLMERYPRQLSGGQRQRVAMGRAIIRNPKAFLFDEPLSNLDAALRVSMRKEIRALHDRLGATSVYVTHDQIEAMTMADHVVVMRAGIIEQQGAPLELYERPANSFVAGFIGSPAMNFVPATMMEGGRLELEITGRPVISVAQRTVAGRPVLAGLRPEHLAISDTGQNTINLAVSGLESTGSTTFIEFGSAPTIAMVRQGMNGVSIGDAMSITIDPGHVHMFAPDTGVRL